MLEGGPEKEKVGRGKRKNVGREKKRKKEGRFTGKGEW